MTNEQIVTVAEKYAARLDKGGWESNRADTSDDHHSVSEQIDHALWMLREIISGKVTGDKAERWLCFAQGVLWCNGLYSIDEMRDDNR